MTALPSHELEQLRRSLVMAPADGRATALTNRQAANLITEIQTARVDIEALLSRCRCSASGEQPQCVADASAASTALNVERLG